VPGHNHRVEFSTDLVNWQPIFNRAGIDGFDFLTSIVGFISYPKGFYRVIRE